MKYKNTTHKDFQRMIDNFYTSAYRQGVLDALKEIPKYPCNVHCVDVHSHIEKLLK